MIFKIRYAYGGTHVHCSLFVAPKADRTFAQAGEFTLRAGEEIDALKDCCPGIEFEQDTLAGLRQCEIEAYRARMSAIARQRWEQYGPEKRQEVREKIATTHRQKKGGRPA